LRDRNIRTAKCVTIESLARLDVYHAANEAHIEIYCAHKKLCVVQCLRMFRFVRYALCLNIH